MFAIKRSVVGVVMILAISMSFMGTMYMRTDAAVQKNANYGALMLDSTNNYRCTLTISETTASYRATVSQKDADSITVTLTLQKKRDGSWVDVKSVTDSTESTALTLRSSRTISSGTYRAKAVITIKSGTSKTTLTKYSTTETK